MTGIVSAGLCNPDGLAVSLHLEAPPGAVEPDRLAVEVRIPLSTLTKLLPAVGETGTAAATHRRGNALMRLGEI